MPSPRGMRGAVPLFYSQILESSNEVTLHSGCCWGIYHKRPEALIQNSELWFALFVAGTVLVQWCAIRSAVGREVVDGRSSSSCG